MAQSGYTPVSLYYSTTAAATPTNTNLSNGELAINITDGKLFYKDNTGTVQVIATKASTTNVASFSAGTTGFTPNTATTGAVTLAGTLATTNGGTGLTSFTSGGIPYATSTSALATGSGLVFTGTNLGVGTSSPTRTLQVSNSSNAIVSAINTSGPEAVVNATTTTGNVGTTNSYPLTISTNGTQALYIDTSQNVGLGVTPSTWSQGKAFEISALGEGLWGNGLGDIWMLNGAYFNGGFKYSGATKATAYRQGAGTSGGTHTWSVAGTGTTGAALTFTDAMTLNNSGALGFGSSPSYGSSGQVLTSSGSGSVPTWTTVSGGASLSANNTWTGTQTFNGTSSTFAEVLTNAAETTTISATAATGTINYDVTTQSVLYYTSNASANWTVNVRGSSGTSLNTLMSTGQTITIVFMVTQGSTAYYNNVFNIDGITQTLKWQGGTAPTAGNASSVDIYTYTIVKIGSANYQIFASQTQFK